jgi:hypothetical protein
MGNRLIFLYQYIGKARLTEAGTEKDRPIPIMAVDIRFKHVGGFVGPFGTNGTS